ncbi:unnamed protein product [Brassica oleracea]|uniref:(rape) hypothetical protein n=1 Tax=Brassica napus TaxID=3708 RepID=A0A816K7D7_BRANA|nr:unnamed protein product [Brassica napus]
MWLLDVEKAFEAEGCRINPDLTRTVSSIRSNRLSKLDAQLVKMAFQASIYWSWRERN